MKICNNHNIGLMFKLKKESLIFIFDKAKNYTIHSMFCFHPFYAIYLLDKKIVDIKYVKPFRISVKSKFRFNTLIEIVV